MHLPLEHTSPAHAGPQSAVVVHVGGIAPVHSHELATQPQPQPQSALTVHVFAGVMHLVPSLLQVSPAEQALVFVHDWQAPLFVQVWIASPVHRVAPSVGHGLALSHG